MSTDENRDPAPGSPPPRRVRSSPEEGAATAASGTPVPVDTSIDPRARTAIVVFLIGPVLWAAHFAVVYLVTEAGCTGSGPGLAVFAPPVPTIATLAATAVVAPACLAAAWWAWRRWAHTGREEEAGRTAGESAQPHADERETSGGVPRAGGTLAFAGLLLSVLSFVSVLMVGLPAAWLSPC